MKFCFKGCGIGFIEVCIGTILCTYRHCQVVYHYGGIFEIKPQVRIDTASMVVFLTSMTLLLMGRFGHEATAVIRDQDSKVLNHSVPIIAMTANDMKSDRERCLAAGMDDFLTNR